METEKIIRYPDERLIEKSEEVADFGGRVAVLGEKLKNILRENKAAGISAIQIGVPLRLLVIKKPDGSGDLVVLGNPEVVKTSGKVIDEEGCLSIPGVWLKIKRPRRVEITARDLEGGHIRMNFSDYFARGIMHELDHLNGKLIWDHLPEEERATAIENFSNNADKGGL